MARDTESLAAMFDVIAGKDATDPFSVPKTESYSDAVANAPAPSELDVAYSSDLGLFSIAPEVRGAIEETLSELEDAGANVDEVSFDMPDFGALTHAYSLQVTTFFATSVEEVNEALDIDLLGDHGEDLPNDLKTLVSMGETNDIMDYTKADFVRTDLYHEVQEVVEEYDALVCPTLATPPLTHEEPMPSEIDGEPTNGLPTSWMLSWIFNLTGHPVVNVPAGMTDGLPVGAQLVGDMYTEATLLGVANAVEETSPWRYPDE
jgi:Asp-tRNA(Asn)/Glu-tRNA(Gln) amidotransferase A subunit family amidase